MAGSVHHENATPTQKASKQPGGLLLQTSGVYAPIATTPPLTEAVPILQAFSARAALHSSGLTQAAPGGFVSR